MQQLCLLGHLFKEESEIWSKIKKKKKIGIKVALVKIKLFLQHKFH